MTRKSVLVFIVLTMLCSVAAILIYLGYVQPRLVLLRDEKRVSDMKLLSQALESYYDAERVYPNGCEVVFDNFPQENTQDPMNTDQFQYAFACTYDAYCGCAKLEVQKEAGNSRTSFCGWSHNTDTADYYCVMSSKVVEENDIRQKLFNWSPL